MQGIIDVRLTEYPQQFFEEVSAAARHPSAGAVSSTTDRSRPSHFRQRPDTSDP